MPARRGVWIFILLLPLIGAVVLLAALRLSRPGVNISSSTILVFDVPDELEEAEAPFRPWSLDVMRWRRPTVLEIVDALESAADDDRIAGLVLHIDGIDWGWGKIAEIRDAITRFRDSGKPVYASLSGGGEAEYLLASAADWITMPPTEVLQLDGLTASAMYLKGTFDKLDIHPNFAHAGQFKSAVERYTQTGMSPASQVALESILDDSYDLLVDSLATSRELPADTIRNRIEDGPYSADVAYDLGLVDSLVYDAEIDSLALRDVSKHGSIVNLMRYDDQVSGSTGGPKIAYIAASGVIVSGRSRYVAGEGMSVGSETLIEALRQARGRRSIKAVVLRIDSPGGMITASDDIWREVRRCSDVKPVIASMSDFAASGGYYIASGADRIVAEPATITGSIGVYAGKLNLLGLYRKLGLNVETLSRGPRAEMMSEFRDFTPDEARRFQDQVDESYELFLQRVSAGRRIAIARVDSIAQGRVWSGLTAHALGLVDTLGGLDAAFNVAVARAGLSEDQGYTIEELPRVDHPFLERLIQDWIGDPDEEGRAVQLPKLLQEWRALARFPSGAALALMPFRVEIR